MKQIIVTFLIIAVGSGMSHRLYAQTREELNELLNSSTTEKKKAPSKDKSPKEKPGTEEKAKKSEAAKSEKPASAVTEKSREAADKTKSTAEQPAVKTAPARGADKVKDMPEPAKIGWRKNRKWGDKLAAMGSWYSAVNYYTEAANKKPNKVFLFQKAADAHFTLRDYATAGSLYRKAISLDSARVKYPLAIYQYALTEKYLGNYENAKVWFETFRQKATADEWSGWRSLAQREIQGCDLGISLRQNETPEYVIQHLRENINQPFTDYAPALLGNTLYYGSWNSDRVVIEKGRERYADYSRIYVSQMNPNGTWSDAEELNSPINRLNFHTGNTSFTPDGKTMYYTQCYQDETGRMICSIYSSTFTSEGWTEGEKLDNAINAPGSSNTHPCPGKNEAGEEGIYFSSNRNASRGFDIYFAKRNGNSFEKPRPVANINTKGDEYTPFFDYKTNTLYFSSNGHINIGGADVFKTVLDRSEWGEPKNMGTPINSSVDDMYFYWSDPANTGFVVSNRPGGFGQKSATCCDDIYQLFKAKIQLAVAGKVLDTDGGNTPIQNCLVTLYDARQGVELRSAYPEKGYYLFDLEPEKEYRLIARKKGFEDLLLSVSTVGRKRSDTIMLDFPLKRSDEKISHIGKTIGVVYWEFNADRLTSSAPDTLQRIVEFLLANPQCVIEIGSHTDSRGTDDYNMKLSQRRSDAVMRYLLYKKISKENLVSKAYGESKPVALNENPDGSDNPAGRAQNRRTEFTVIRELSREEMQKQGDKK
ncbi:MAG: OmpA family protein [Chitinophagales bacterium]|nr:OmpA family protein [Chitinophagales bacterium]MDW8419469.1 OmpA family protein [Chitinophagales bacterium]